MPGLTPTTSFAQKQRLAGSTGLAPQLPRFRGNDESEFPGWDLNLPSDPESDVPPKGRHSGKASPLASAHSSANASKTSLDGLSEDVLHLSLKKESKSKAHKSESEPKDSRKKTDEAVAQPKSKHGHEAAPTHAHSVEKLAKKAPKSKRHGGDGDEPVTLEAPPEEQYAHYAAQQQLQKQLEWGKRFESAGRAVDWVEDQVKWAGRRSAVIAHGFGESAKGLAAQAVITARKSAASQLRRLVDVLDGESKPPVELELSDRSSQESLPDQP